MPLDPYRARSDRDQYRKALEPEGSERFGGPPLVAGGSPFSKLNQLAVAAFGVSHSADTHDEQP